MYTIDVTPDQLRAARHMLRWSQQDLAWRSGISRVSLSAIETGKSQPRIDTMRDLVRALEAAGIELTDDGVRMIRRS
jgi:DNA-binding XRE family transcriptional regulator